MSSFLKFLMLASCLLGFACKKSTSANPSEAPPTEPAEELEEVESGAGDRTNSYLGPLEVGLEYQYLMMMSGGGVPPKRYTATYRVERKKEIKGKTYHEVHVDTGGYPMLDNFVEYYRTDEDGFYAIAHDDETQTEFMSFPRPIPTEVGETWQIERPGKEPEQCTILGFETVTLFGITYEDCLKVRRDAEQCRMTGWLAKGLGSVKFVQDYGHGVLVFLRRPEVEGEENEKTADGKAPPAVGN